jgi:hypothetical protein
VDQNEFDTSDGWENEDNLIIVSSITKKVNDDWGKKCFGLCFPS